MINGPGIFDVLDAFKEDCKKAVSEGKLPPIGSKVRVLAAFNPDDEMIVGRVGVVDGYFMMGAVGRVDFKRKVTKQYSLGREVCTQVVFPVNRWESVPPDTELGPEFHRKLDRTE